MDEPVSPRTSSGQRDIPQCCCGRTDCAFLSHNGELLESLERDVQTAAQLGQALLQRHEAYIADSEAERRRMAAKIESLESEKADLEARNARTVQENRSLLDQLEAINNANAETDSHCHELTAALMETQEELQRMTNLASRTESLERQLAELEKEQLELQNKLNKTSTDEKSAVKRWRRAEQTIAALSEQIERIEKEAKEERERHVEVISRMDRRRAVERELETAAGRLKGAAAAKAGSHDRTGTNVVSHFVKDILQDNANLQLGIVELRDMLMNSNDEVERLREQLLLHQPISEASELEPSGPSLEKELGMEAEEPQDRQETLKEKEARQLHVHHHYHAAPAAAPAPATITKDPRRGHLQRRASKKRRSVVTPSHFAPPPGMPAPRSSLSLPRPTTPSSAATILSQTAVTIPSTAKHSHRWSVASQQTNISMAPSSVPSSPYSRRTSSIFDRMLSDAGQESSRPTSPESNNDPGSPDFAPIATRGKGPARTLTTPAAFKLHSKAAPPIEVSATASSRISEEELNNLSPICQDVITEEQETASDADISGLTDTPTPEVQDSEVSEEAYMNGQVGHGLRRATSHESLLSVRGMDISVHARPSHMYFAPSSPSSQAMASLSNMVARPSISYRHDQDASAAHRSLLAGFTADQRSGGQASRPKQNNSGGGGIGRKVGGWVFGKWGFAPTPTHAAAPATTAAETAASTSTPAASSSALSPNAQAPAAQDGRASSSSTASSSTATTEVPAGAPPSSSLALSTATLPRRSKSLKHRPTGINQAGPIQFLAPRAKAAAAAAPVNAKVVVKQDEVDVDALRESLAEAGDSPVRTEPQIRIEPPPPETTAV